MYNKLNKEDKYLSIEQIKELQELGIEEKNIYDIRDRIDIMDMLNIVMETSHGYYVDIKPSEDFYIVQYIDESKNVVHYKDMIEKVGKCPQREDIAVSTWGANLCDALFNMIKFLKTNNLM